MEEQFVKVGLGFFVQNIWNAEKSRVCFWHNKCIVWVWGVERNKLVVCLYIVSNIEVMADKASIEPTFKA